MDSDYEELSNSSSYDILAQSCRSTTSTLRSYGEIKRLRPRCSVHNMILEYVSNSKGDINIKVRNIFKINRKNERVPFDQNVYRMLLWHGTKPGAVPGIINTGFRIGTGGLYGGGIYFADRIAKSASYVGLTSEKLGYFVLAEIDLGRVFKAHHTHSDYKASPPGFDSVKGNGKEIPIWRNNKKYKGITVPCGKSRNNPRHPDYDLNFNEYIVYDPQKIIIRFLIECHFPKGTPRPCVIL